MPSPEAVYREAVCRAASVRNSLPGKTQRAATKTPALSASIPEIHATQTRAHGPTHPRTRARGHPRVYTQLHALVPGDTRSHMHTRVCTYIHSIACACLRARAHTGRRDTRTYKYRHTLARTKREAVGQCCVCKACAQIFLSPGTLSYKINPTDGPLASGSAGDPGEDFKSKCEVLKFLFIS